VGELINNQQRGSAGDGGVKVERLARCPDGMLGGVAGQTLHALQESIRLRTAMCVDHPDHDVRTYHLPPSCRLQHRERLSGARCCAEKHGKLPAAR
jgi:hypothetical protein